MINLGGNFISVGYFKGITQIFRKVAIEGSKTFYDYFQKIKQACMLQYGTLKNCCVALISSKAGIAGGSLYCSANRTVKTDCCYVLETYHSIQPGALTAHHKTVETIAVLKGL